MLPVTIRFVLTYPDGRTKTAEGTGDAFGSFVGAERWPLDVTGVYRYRLDGRVERPPGGMPGLPTRAGSSTSSERRVPSGTAGCASRARRSATFSADDRRPDHGQQDRRTVRYAVIMPGAVIDQGELAVAGGRFRTGSTRSPSTRECRLYDVVNNRDRQAPDRPARPRHVLLEEETPAGTPFFDFARVILRGTTALQPRTGIPVAASAAAGPAGAPVGSSAAADIALAATSPGEIRTWDRTVDAMLLTGELRVVKREADTLLQDVLHERLQQYHAGVAVLGGELRRQLLRGATVSIFGTVQPGITLDTTPAFTADDARAVIEHRCGGVLAEGATPSLVVLPVDTGHALAWLAEVSTVAGREICAVDASDGELLGRGPAGHDGELAGFAAADRRREVAAVVAFYANAFRMTRIAVGSRLPESGAPLPVIAHVMAHDLLAAAPLVSRDESAALEEAYARIVAIGVTGGELAGLDERERDEIQKILLPRVRLPASVRRRRGGRADGHHAIRA